MFQVPSMAIIFIKIFLSCYALPTNSKSSTEHIRMVDGGAMNLELGSLAAASGMCVDDCSRFLSQIGDTNVDISQKAELFHFEILSRPGLFQVADKRDIRIPFHLFRSG